MSKGAVLFDDIFDIKARDPDGKKFDKGGLAAMQASTKSKGQPKVSRSQQVWCCFCYSRPQSLVT
jgi:hypothetical protein